MRLYYIPASTYGYGEDGNIDIFNDSEFHGESSVYYIEY